MLKKGSQTFTSDTQPAVSHVDPEAVPDDKVTGQRALSLIGQLSLDWEPGREVYDDIAAYYGRT